MSYCKIENCKFVDSILIDSRVSQTTVIQNDFERCDMSGINVEGSIFKNNYCEDAIGTPYEMM